MITKRLSDEDPFFAKVVESQLRLGQARRLLHVRQRGRLQAGLRARVQDQAADGLSRSPGISDDRGGPAVPPLFMPSLPRTHSRCSDSSTRSTSSARPSVTPSPGASSSSRSAPATRCSCATLLNDPTSWAFDLSYLMYGAVFYMAGAYTLSRGGHVRADMFYRMWRPRTQAIVELVLYVLFFFPGILALVDRRLATTASSRCASARCSVNSPAGVPIWPLKMMIQFGAGLIALQGLAEVLRCVVCLRERRLACAAARRRGAREPDPEAARGARPRNRAAQGARAMSDPAVALVDAGHPGLHDHASAFRSPSR